MKPPAATEVMHKQPQHTDYIQPPENISLKSPLELLANACNKLETSMMSQSNGGHHKTTSSSLLFQQDQMARKGPSPPQTAVPSSTHLPLRMAPTRNTAEPISLTKTSHTKPELHLPYSLTAEAFRQRISPPAVAESRQGISPPPVGDLRQRMSPPIADQRQRMSPPIADQRQRMSPPAVDDQRRLSPELKQDLSQPSTSEPISLVNRPNSVSNSPVSHETNMPQNLSKPKSPERKEAPTGPPVCLPNPPRPEVASLKVKPAEALSPVGGPQAAMINKRATPSPRSVGRPATISPVSSMSPRPTHPSMMSSMGLPPGTGYPGIPGFPPGYPPYMSLGAAPQAPAAPCTDPMCRDPSCPTFAMRAAQAQLLGQLSAAAGIPGMPMGYPYSLPPGLAGLGGSMGSMPGFPYGIPVSLPGPSPPSMSMPGMLPPHLMGLPTTSLPPLTLAQTQPTMSVSSAPTLSGVGASPYMCSWMQGRDFCGRRFNSSEELMSHLRSHTANMGTEPSPPPASVPQPTSALAMLQAQAAQLRGQISPPESSRHSPSEAQRYHPYGRPGGLSLPASLQGSPMQQNQMLSSLYGSPRPILPVLP